MKPIQKIKKLSHPLCHIISHIDNDEDAFNFLRDLLTEDELIEASQRLLIAYMLSQKTPYTQIQKETWASSTTIARVAKYLHGEYGGYRKYIPLIS